MSTIFKSGMLCGVSFYIQDKEKSAKAKFGKEEQNFQTWDQAVEWVDKEADRMVTGETKRNHKE